MAASDYLSVWKLLTLYPVTQQLLLNLHLTVSFGSHTEGYLNQDLTYHAILIVPPTPSYYLPSLFDCLYLLDWIRNYTQLAACTFKAKTRLMRKIKGMLN